MYNVLLVSDEPADARPIVTDPAVPPMTTAASPPEGDVFVAIVVPTTEARIVTPVAADGSDPEVNVDTAWPSATDDVAIAAVVLTTGAIDSPPPVGFRMLNATVTPPTGLPFTSNTDASNVEIPVVLPRVCATTLGLD
jgi:hypothetical protein